MSHSVSSFNPTADSISPVKFPPVSGLEAQDVELENLRRKLGAHMENLFLGPMPIESFLKDFLPMDSATRKQKKPRVSKTYFDAIPKGQEHTMYEPFVNLINNSGLIPGFKMVNTSAHLDKDGNKNRPLIKPDPSMYRENLEVEDKVTQMGELEAHNELKSSDDDDAFKDNDEFVFQSLTERGRRTRNQLIHYATEWFSRQHRRHGFTIFMFGSYVRFIRWDRAGAIVTQKFNFRKDSTHLQNFLWRFSHLNAAGRGRDPYVRAANAKEIEIAHQELHEWKPTVERPVLVFTIPVENGKHRDFIGWGSMSGPYSLIGRSTKGYPVYEQATKTKAFLKDGWRAHSLSPEADILRELQEKKVQYVPGYVCGGDVPDSVTHTDLYVTAEESGESEDEVDVDMETKHHGDVTATKRDGSWKHGKSWRRVIQRFLHRFVTDIIAKPLNTFKNSKHMIEVVSHAFTAHRQAYELCDIIHRDVSANNILITDSGGILNDWDMAKKRADIQRRRKHERTGTWEFMSSLLLAGHHSAHTIQDDMESFVLIVIYHALRYFEHNQARRTLYIINQVFNNRTVLPDGDCEGGEGRLALFQNKNYITRNFQLTSPPLHRWVWTTIKVVREWIRSELPNDDDDDYPVGDYIASITQHTSFPAPQSPAIQDRPTGRKRSLDDHSKLANIFAGTLTEPNWPEDVPHDILPELRAAEKRAQHGRGTQDIGPSQRNTGEMRRSAQLASNGEHNPSKTSKRGRMGEDVGGSGQSIKRSRTSVNTTSPRRVTGMARPRLPSKPSQSRARPEDGRSNAGQSRGSGEASGSVDPLRRTRASSAVSGKKKSPRRRSGGSQPSQNRRKH
ncbi:hypothetical protein H0H93_012346 [Arthromyces matolae]|nr:hypothetical protein H0H93_012346 [Arthromyces matolae]